MNLSFALCFGEFGPGCMRSAAYGLGLKAARLVDAPRDF